MQRTHLAVRDGQQRHWVENFKLGALDHGEGVIAVGDGVVAALVGGVDIAYAHPRQHAIEARAHLRRDTLARQPYDTEGGEVGRELRLADHLET